MMISRVQKKKLVSLEFWCAFLFFLSLILNDCFGEKPGYHMISNYLILLFMISVLFLIWAQETRIPIIIIVLLAMNLLWWTLSCVWTVGNAGFIYTLSLNLLLGLMSFCFFYHSKNYEVLFYALFVSGIVLMVFSFFIYGFEGFFEILQEEERLGGEISNENTFGKVFAYGVIAGLYLVIYQKKYWSIIVSFLFLGFSLASGSRKAILIIIIGVTLLLLIRVGLKRPVAYIVILTIVISLLFFILQLPMFSVANERFTTLIFGGPNDYSTNTRNRMIAVGVDLFAQKPLTGWGIAGYASASGFNKYSHNNFIEILVNYGIIGFILYYAMHTYILLTLSARIKSAIPQQAMMFTIILTSLIMDYGNVSYDMKWMWMILGAGMALSIDVNKKRTHQSKGDRKGIANEVEKGA